MSFFTIYKHAFKRIYVQSHAPQSVQKRSQKKGKVQSITMYELWRKNTMEIEPLAQSNLGEKHYK